MNSLLKKLNDYSLYLLIFSITFEKWDPLNTAGSLSVAFITSILYIATWLPFLKSRLNLFIFSRYTSLLILFLLVGFVSTAFKPEYLMEFRQAYNYRVLLLIILMHLIANHLYNDARVIPKAINAYLWSVVLMFGLFIVGVGVTYEQERLLIFKENPNIIGIKAVIAFIIVLGRIFSKPVNLKTFINPIILILPISISLILASGSRGAFLSIFIGFALIILFKKNVQVEEADYYGIWFDRFKCSFYNNLGK